VMDAAVRSFPPVKPKCLRWSWPFFTVAEELDPDLLLETTRKKKPVDSQDAPNETASSKREKADDAKFLAKLDTMDPDRLGVAKSQLKAMLGFNTDRMLRVETRLIRQGIIEYIPNFTVSTPNGGRKEAVGLRRVERRD
jgi:hypothetical protein